MMLTDNSPSQTFRGLRSRLYSRRTKVEILLRQKGRCADCGARLNVERIIVFDHPPAPGPERPRRRPKRP